MRPRLLSFISKKMLKSFFCPDSDVYILFSFSHNVLCLELSTDQTLASETSLHEFDDVGRSRYDSFVSEQTRFIKHRHSVRKNN